MNEQRDDNETSPWSKVFEEVMEVASRGQEILVQQARSGKFQLERRRLKRDRRILFERLGREAYHLLEDERIPMLAELERPFEVLQELDERLQDMESRTGQI